MKKMITLLTAMLLLLSACSSATLDGAGKELEDTIANATDADNKYVQMVKGGYRTDNPDVTYEDAFTSFFGTPRWKYFEGEDGQDVVEFTGDCTYRDVPVKARIQFVVDEESGTFEATYLAFNEVPQDALTLAAVISKAFEQSQTSSSNGESNDFNSDDFYYEEKCLTDLLGKTSADVSSELGTPTGGTPVTGELLYGGTEYWIYNDELGLYFDNSTVSWISVRSTAVTRNGETLNKTDSEIYDEFGNPTYEKFMEEDEEGGGYYYMEYALDGIVVGFEIPDTSSTVNNVMLSLLDDGMSEEEYQETSPALDYALVGRWRSFDGGTLQFEDNGMISACDFNCWSLVGEKPERVYWETSNGRVYCSAYFDNNITYTITSPSTEPEKEYISFSSNRRHKYQRAAGEKGNGIIGTWLSVENSIWSFEFNADGTGIYNGKYSFTWNTYTADDGSGALSYTLLDSTYFDYSVGGDTLTVFLSDSSRVYTKVGN